MTDAILISLAVFLRITSNPLANVFQKKLATKGNHPLLVNFLTYALLSIVCLFFVGSIQWAKLPQQFWLYAVLGGIVGAVGNGFLVKALQKGDLSVLGPINAYKSVVAIVVGIFLLGEILNIWGAIGIVLIIYGSYFVLDTTKERFTLKLLKKSEIQFRIWAMLLTAIEAVFTKKVILATSVELAFMSWCIFGAFFSFILLYIDQMNVKNEISKVAYADIGKYLVLILCVGTMQFTTNYSLNHLPVGYALSFFQLSTIISVLFGYKIFKEQDIRKKLAGSAIMVIGSILIIILKDR